MVNLEVRAVVLRATKDCRVRIRRARREEQIHDTFARLFTQGKTFKGAHMSNIQSEVRLSNLVGSVFLIQFQPSFQLLCGPDRKALQIMDGYIIIFCSANFISDCSLHN